MEWNNDRLQILILSENLSELINFYFSWIHQKSMVFRGVGIRS